MEAPRKFIMIVNCYPHPFPVHDKEDYFLLPCSVMKDKGFECEYVTLRNQGKNFIENKFANDTAAVEYTKGFKVTRFDSMRKLLGYVKKSKAVVQCNLRSFPPSSFAAFLPNRKVMRSYTYVMGSSLPIALFSAFVFRRFDRILAVTPYEAEIYRKWKVPEKKITLLPLAVDCEYFGTRVPADDMREKYGIKPNDKVIIALANVRKNKRFDVLLRALKVVLNEIPEAKALIVGEDMLHAQNLPSMKEIASGLGILDSVILAGHHTDEGVRKLYSISDVFVHPAENEYQGLVSYEAAAMGIPLCLSNIGSHTTVFREHALYHDVEDHEQLARNIIATIKHRDQREESVRFLKQYMRNWDYPVMFKRMGELYDEILNE